MSSKPNKTLIGAFVLGALALAVAGVILLGSGKFFQTTRRFVLYFEGSVNGLSVGSQVVFRGVPIGSVAEIDLEVEPQSMTMTIPVFVEIESNRFKIAPKRGSTSAQAEEAARERKPEETLQKLIELGLRAQLELQSMVTGQLMVNLDFEPSEPARLLGDGSTLEIPTIPSPYDKLAKTIEKLPLQEIVSRVLEAVEGIDRIVNSPETSQLALNMNQAMLEARDLLSDVQKSLPPLMTNLDQTLSRYGSLATKVESKVGPLATGMDQTLNAYTELAKTLNAKSESLSTEVNRALERLDSVLSQAERVTSGAGGVLEENSQVMVDLRSTLNELSGAARSIRVWADYLERHPEALIQGKGDYRR